MYHVKARDVHVCAKQSCDMNIIMWLDFLIKSVRKFDHNYIHVYSFLQDQCQLL